MENRKNAILLAVVAIATLLLCIIGATFAYFQARSTGGANTDVDVITNTTDKLSFQVGSAISLTANQEDFGQGAGNKSGSTFARATLTANNATNNATRNYYVYLNIESNDFEYTTEDNQAEILLKVTDPDGTEVTTLGSLERKTSGGVTGFDITTSTGLITIADNYEITSTGTVTQEWQVEVVFANLNSDQNANAGKSFSANLIIQEEPMVTSLGNFAEYITQTLYTGTDGDNDLYYHDGVGTYINANQEAGDNSYRFSGANPNNYVCFGSTVATCPSDNLYRIIGVFGNQVKLIKYDYASISVLGSHYDGITIPNAEYYKGDLSYIPCYYWSGSSSNDNNTDVNTWSESQLNTVNLNTNYLNNIGSTWSSKIATTRWKVGGNTYDNLYRDATVQTSYQYEIKSPAESTTYNAKIGLMYLSDYGYATSPENWNEYMMHLNYVINNNWMYMGVDEWTITRRSGTPSGFAFYITQDGSVDFFGVKYRKTGIRPTFYLNSDVELESGTGSASDPYRLA